MNRRMKTRMNTRMNTRMTNQRARGGAVAAALLLLSSAPALAQYGGGGFGQPGGMQPPPPMGQEPKEEGPAEEAPEEEGRPADLEPLTGYAEQNRRRMQIFELDGYLRLRSDYLHNFALGQGYTSVKSVDPTGAPVFGRPPFPVPLECATGDPTSTTSGTNCSHKSIGAANLRLRLEPTLNVTDMVRVHAQIDVLDNTILGSTPDSLAGLSGYNRVPTATGNGETVSPTSMPGVAPAPYLYNTQDPPEIGQNGLMSSIRAKRAWGEIDSEFGSIRFGRMPWHWGRGIYYNAGACPDCDVGSSVDRVMGLTQLYGHQLALAWDLGPQGTTTQQLSLGRDDPNGYQYDLSQNDDVMQLMASIARIDNPVSLRERIDRGDIVVNYGLQLVYRNQGNAQLPANATPTTGGAPNNYGPQAPTPEQVPRPVSPTNVVDALTVTPDVWFKLQYKALTVEFEGVAVLGRVKHAGVLVTDTPDDKLTLRQFGWVLASELRLYRDSFFVGVETGGATGDQAEDPSQYLNYRWKFVRQPAGDHTLADFHFSPSYHVDEILFRHILGTVTNAVYFKPQAAYWLDLGQSRAVGLTGGVIYSLAQVPVSTPGNALTYGVETNVGATYRNTAEGIYGGFTWAVLWPLAALERPAGVWGTVDARDATAAQVLRIFMGIRF